MAASKKKMNTPVELDLDLRIRIWIYENVGPLFSALPEPLENGDGEDSFAFPTSRHDKKMTAYAGTLEAVESLLELFPLRDRGKVENELVRLFINTQRGVPAPPYASWHIDGQLMGPTTEWVVEQYRAQGLDASEGGEPSDFITTEFEFMEHLCRHELAARTTGDDEALKQIIATQKVFVEHLVRWLPRLAIAIRKADPIPLFARVARILEIFTEEEEQTMAGR